jgi:hypothetical protein
VAAVVNGDGVGSGSDIHGGDIPSKHSSRGVGPGDGIGGLSARGCEDDLSLNSLGGITNGPRGSYGNSRDTNGDGAGGSAIPDSDGGLVVASLKSSDGAGGCNGDAILSPLVC